MNDEIVILERFKLFFSLLGITKSELARRLKISNQNINRLMVNFSCLEARSLEINKLGCNLNWLFNGVGKATSDNENGYRLNQTSAALTEDGFLKSQLIKKRIISWIEFNFKSIDLFYIHTKNEEVLSLKDKKFESVENEIINNSIYFSLEEAGCNLSWIFNDENETPFNNNDNGISLKEYYSKNKETKNILSELILLKFSERNLN